MSHIGYMIFDTQLDRELRDGRHDGRIDLETAFERYRSRIPFNDVDTVLALKKRSTPRLKVL